MCDPSVYNATCNYQPGSINFFKGDIEYDFYGYNVWTWNAAIFVGVYGLMTLTHLGLSIYSRQWWTLYTLFLGSAGELIGWGGRLWSALSTKWSPEQGGYWWSNENAFLMQISVLIFSPAFLAAGNYILLGRIIPILGPRYTFIHPLSYTVLFVIGDLVSLIVQAIGGGRASASDTLEEANRGGYIMVGGVMFQMVVMVAYTIVLLMFIYRWRSQKPFAHQIELLNWWPNALRVKSMKKGQASSVSSESSGGVLKHADSDVSKGIGRAESGDALNEKIIKRRSGFGNAGALGGVDATEKEVKGAKILLGACLSSTLFIFIRSIYRSIELLAGWNGPIIENQSLFNFLDGMLIAMATAIFIVFHPGFFLPRTDRR